MADQDFKVKFTTSADLAGANAAAAALERSAAAAKKTGGEFEKTGNLAEQLGKKGSSAKDVYEGLTATLNGGTGSVFGLAKAWSNLSAAMAANPLGAAIAVALALAPALLGVIKGFTGTAEAAKDAGTQIDGAAVKAEKLGAVRLETLKADLKAVDDSARSTGDALKALDDVAQRLDDARQAVELARLETTPNLTDDQRKAGEFAIRQRYTARRRGREDNAGAEGLAALDQVLAQKNGLATAKGSALEEQQALIAGLPDAAAARRRITDIRAGQAVPIFQSDEQKARDKFNLSEAEAQLKEAESEQGKARRAREEAELKRREEEAKVAAAEVLAAANRAEEARRVASIQRDRLPEIRGAEDQLARLKAGVPAPANIPRSLATVSGFGDVAIAGRPFSGAGAGTPLQYGGSPQIQIGDQSFAPVAQKIGQEVGAAAAAALDRNTAIIIDGVTAALRAAEARTIERMKNARN